MALARVVGAGHVGMLAGPALIGFVAGKVGRSNAFVLPLLFCVVGVALAATASRDEPARQTTSGPTSGTTLDSAALS